LISQVANGQFLPEFSGQINTPEFINPGFNASKQKPTGIFLYSNNFKKMEGYNGLFAINLNLPVNNWHTGFGATFINEFIGDIGKTNGTFNTCVNVTIWKSTYLAFGLGLGFERIDSSDIKNRNQFNSSSAISNFIYSSSGLNLFSENLHLGLGVHCTQLGKKLEFNYEYFTYFLNGSYNFVMEESPSIKPVLMYCYYLGVSHYEAGVFMNFNKVFETGVTYRSNQSIICFAEINFFKLALLGYCFQYKFEESSHLSDGLHEFSLKFILPNKF